MTARGRHSEKSQRNARSEDVSIQKSYEMKSASLALATIGIVLLIGSFGAAPLSRNGYVGAGRCLECHQEQYDGWIRSGHAQILRRPYDPGVEDIPFPHGRDADSISYIIGGFRWKALFLDNSGFLITSAPSGGGKNQFNIRSRRWVDYRSGQKVPYDCGPCHTTGYSQEGHQAGLEGIRGTWKFDGVQCEACHGPGLKHVSSPLENDMEADVNVCSRCHGKEPYDVIPLTDVFLSQYTEVNQLIRSGKRDFACVDCHSPHLPSGESIKVTCVACHREVAQTYQESFMHKVGVKCTDCHMPPAGMVAEGDTDSFDGDLKSHLFRIDHRENLTAVVDQGLRVNPGYLSVDYACMRCHQTYEDREWAKSYSTHAHEIKITTNIRIKRFQLVFAAVGFLFAFLSLLSALSLRNWLLSTANKKKMAAAHRHFAWISLYVYVVMSAICIYFHVPLDDPLKALNADWFLIHLINGFLGIAIYAGKFLAVRTVKKGWGTPGLFWGVLLFVFWLVQFGTVIL